MVPVYHACLYARIPHPARRLPACLRACVPCRAAPSWTACAKDPEACNATQVHAMDQYILDFESTMSGAGPTYAKPGNGYSILAA